MALDLKDMEARLRARLDALDAEDRTATDSQAPVELDQESVGRLSRMDALQGQAMAVAAGVRRRQERDRIHAALRRIADDDFGWCLRCGDAIAEARLKNDPTVIHCIECAAAG